MKTPPSLDEQFVWFNGSLLRAGEVRVSPFDRGLLVGEGAFETLVARDGKPFAMDRHLRRLLRGCELLTLPAPDGDALRRGIAEVLAANAHDSGLARVRITMTGGAAPLGAHFESAKPTVIIASSPAVRPVGSVRLASVPFTRNERSALVGIKAISYAENLVALELAQKHGADEAIIANSQGKLAEGAVSNLFMIKDGVLVTPSLESGCLPGVTRELVMEICREQGIPCEERDVPLSEFLAAECAFITSSIRGVQAVAAIDRRPLPETAGHSLLGQLADALQAIDE